MTRPWLLVLAVAVVAAGCKKGEQAAKPAPPAAPDNAVTRHVGELQNDLKKSQSAAQKANEAIGRTAQAVDEAGAEAQ